MAETTAIPIVVLSRHQDAGELINSTLRNAGHAVHCTWVRELGRLGDTLAQTGIIHIGSAGEAHSRLFTQVVHLVKAPNAEDPLP